MPGMGRTVPPKTLRTLEHNFMPDALHDTTPVTLTGDPVFVGELYTGSLWYKH